MVWYQRQFGFFKERPQELAAGHFLYTWNAYAALAWKEMGVSRFVVSWEDDVLNKKAGDIMVE